MFFFFCEFGCHNLKWSIICWVFLKLVCGITKISQTNTHSQILSQKTLSFPDEFYIVAEKLHMCDGQGQKVQRKWWGRKLSRLKTACTCHPTPPPFLLHNIFTQNLRRILGKFLSFFPCTMKACDKMLARCQQCAAEMWQTIILFILFQMDFRPSQHGTSSQASKKC